MRLRLDEAKRLMATTDLALAEIAARLGYYNAAYITNIFKRHVTMLSDGNRPATPAYKISNL